MVIIQIEHINALKNLDRILAVEGIDSICIGPCDLSASMGKLGEDESSEVEQIIDAICKKVYDSGLMIGSFADVKITETLEYDLTGEVV